MKNHAEKNMKKLNNQQDRPSIFEERKYIRSFSNRDFSKNMIVSQDVLVDINSTINEYKSTNCLIGKVENITSTFVEPNIVQMNSSYIIKDYDGEMLSTYKDMLTAGGYNVKIINYMDTKKSLKYNIFNYINYEEDVYNFVRMVTKSNVIGLSKGQLLLKNAENLLLEAIIYYIMSELPHEEHCIETIQRMLKLAEPKGEVSEEYDSDLNMLFAVLDNNNKGAKDKKNKDENKDNIESECNNEDNIALERYKQFLLASKHMENVIIKNVEQYLSVYYMNSIKRITNDDTLKVEDIFDTDKVIVFIVVPKDNENYEYMADMLMTQLIIYLQYVAEQKYCGRLPKKIHIITYNLMHNDILKLVKEAHEYNIILSVGIDNIEKMMPYYENIYDVIDSFSMLICYDYKEALMKEYIEFRVYEENKDILKEGEIQLSEYMEEENKDQYLILFKYTKPIIGIPYAVKEMENYMYISEQAKEYKMDLLKEEVKSQIYRNLVSQIEDNTASVKVKENVNVDIASKTLVADNVYENISTKVNKELLKDI